jgi:aspartyl-tRNA(Asn)/glutamyl-tRNA(Gln) amidotransferase subunit A
VLLILVLRVTIIPAPQIDEETINIDGEVLLRTRDALLRNTIIFNSTGLPAVSIPIGLTKDNMPVGVQIIGAPFKEHLILSLAYNCECINNKGMDKFIPPLCC